MSLMTIWKYVDGYYGVGEEGQYKTFTKEWDVVLAYLDLHQIPHPNLTRNYPKIRETGESFSEIMNG